MVPLDSAHRIGVYTFFREVLTVDEGVCGLSFEKCDMGNVFASPSTTSEDTRKWMAPSDSAHRIGVNTLLNEVLTQGKGSVEGALKSALFERCFLWCKNG